MRLVNYLASEMPSIVRFQLVEANLPVLKIGDSNSVDVVQPTPITGVQTVLSDGISYTSDNSGIFTVPAESMIKISGKMYDENGIIGEVGNIPDVHLTYVSVIADRNYKLNSTDWMVIRHRDQLYENGATTLSAEQYAELLAYRQILRDLPEIVDFNNVVWPTPPSFL